MVAAETNVKMPANYGYPEVQTGVFTKDVHGYTDRLLSKVTEIGRAAAFPVDVSESSSSSWNSFTFINIGGGGRSSGNSNDQLAWVIIGVITMAVGAILYFTLREKNEDLKQQIQKLADANLGHWQYTKQGFSNEPEIASKIQNTVDLANTILVRQSRETMKKIMGVAVPLLVGGAAMVIGGIYVIPTACAVGTVLAIWAIGYGIFKSIDKSVARANQRDGLQILDNIQDLTGEYPVKFARFNVVFTFVLPPTYYAYRETHSRSDVNVFVV